MLASLKTTLKTHLKTKLNHCKMASSSWLIRSFKSRLQTQNLQYSCLSLASLTQSASAYSSVTAIGKLLPIRFSYLFTSSLSSPSDENL